MRENVPLDVLVFVFLNPCVLYAILVVAWCLSCLPT